MPWPVIMLMQNTAAAVFALQSRRLASKYKDAHFQVLSIIFGVLYISGLLYVAITNQVVAVDYLLDYSFRLVAGGLLFGLWAYFSYRVFAYVDAAIASLLATLNIVAVVIISSLFLHESLNILQFFGAILLFSAMLLVLTRKVSKKLRAEWNKGVMLSLAASSTYGFAIANEKWLLNRMGIGSYVVLGLSLQWLPILLLSFIIRPKMYGLLKNPNFIKDIGLAGVARGLAGILFIISMVSANNASLISVLSGFKVVLSALLAAIILKETKFLKVKITAGIIACGGIACLVWK